MNSTIVYRIGWWFLGLFSSNLQSELLEWGIQKRVFDDGVKKYETLQTSFLDRNLKSPIGVSAGLDFEETTTDLLIQQGAGFGTLGSYTLNATPDHQQKLYFKAGRHLRTVTHYMAKRNILSAFSKLIQRRHLPYFVGINLVSFNAEDIHINPSETAPGYLSEFQIMTQKVAPYCDYLVIDVSSPLMPLYNLVSDESSIVPLIETVQETAQIAAPISTPKIVLKVPFDLSPLEVKSISQISLRMGIDAIMIAGTASLHKNPKWVKSKKFASYSSSAFMTGSDLKEGQIRLLREFRKCTNGCIPLIASGVVMTGADVFDLLSNGASVVEAGIAFYINGPTAVQRMNAELNQILRKKKIRQVSDVIGMSVPIDPNLEIQELFD